MLLRSTALFFLGLLAACGDVKKSDLNGWFSNIKFTGGLRMERAPGDAPVDAATLIRNFRKIAYELESNPFGYGPGAPRQEGRSMLKRWESDVHTQIVWDEESAAGPADDTIAFARKLSDLTGVPLKVSQHEQVSTDLPDADNVNFFVFLGTGEFFENMLAELKAPSVGDDEEMAEVSSGFLEFFATWHRSYSPCAAQSYSETSDAGDTGRIFLAFVAIRTDLQDPMTQSCIEEELAQSMGLMNDDKDVRPSLFNDDHEFALLTNHDELLLKVLYDARLTAGMSAPQSMPIVRQIARELLPDD